MQLKNFAVIATALFLTLFYAAPLVAQEEETADLESPSDTTDNELVAKGVAEYASLTDKDIRERLSYLSSCVDVRTNGVVRGYIKNYVYQKSEKARIMLGRRLTYFPLFEQKLKEYGLPLDLKYLAVVESALSAKAVSRVGATGLWQFMPATGSDYGLRSNSAVEDRSNPVKSTDAAARYLRDLHEDFGDWALALAAYNSGPGRVNAAIRRAGSRNFWSIQRYLPSETSNYVPAFIAATYLCNYYNIHGLRPNEVDFDQQLTAYVNVFEGISFRDISEATGIPYSMIKELNPGFKRDYVPPTNMGHYVIVPQRVMPAFIRYLNTVSGAHKYVWDSPTGAGEDFGDGRYYDTQVTVAQAEHIDFFASRMGLCGDQLRTWNKLTTSFVYPNQVLKLWYPVLVQKHSGAIKVDGNKAKVQSSTKPAKENSKPGSTPVATKPDATPAPKQQAQPDVQSMRRQKPSDGDDQYQYHTVQRNESLEDIARQYATSAERLKTLNAITTLKVGMRLKIRER